ncbi:MAG: hypothetical protein J6A83_06965 [Clostridia bacterium]|nr:hypothetical protein [Clostridia bacterium]
MADTEKMKEKVAQKAKNNVKRKVKRKAKSKAKKIHPATYIIALLCLALGIGAGAGACALVSRDDCFKLRGDKSYTVSVGAPLVYKDEGVKIVEFGRDISDKVEIRTNLTENDDGSYNVDTTEPCEYYIIYTVDSVKYGKIQRVRTITVKGDS